VGGGAEAVVTVSGAVVDATRVSKTFGRTTVLRELTLAVARGETLALFGPNGAGKSTLLRLLATISRATGGRLLLFGSERFTADVRRRIGVVTHQSFLYPELGARENLIFYGRLYEVAHPERAADAWLERVALADEARRPVRLLSRGMEQRLAVARALLHEPELILLDEPWSGLDAAAADLLTAILRDVRAGGRTIVVATHDFDRGLALADRAAILHRGRLVWESRVEAAAPPAVGDIYRSVTGAVAA
jgi:heme exporter protein A